MLEAEGVLWSCFTVIELLRRLGVKVEVFEEFGGPVLVVPLAVAALPPQMAPRVLQLQETHPLHQKNKHVFAAV